METITVNNPAAENQSAFETLAETWATIRAICHFVPILCSLVWIIYYATNPPAFLANYILFPLLVIGWAAAIIASPVRFLKMTFGLIAGGWTLGWTLCPFFPMCLGTGLMGAALGLMGGIFLAVFAPAAVTIYNFFKD